MATHTLMTAEQFDRLPVEEDRNLELLDGEVIEMSTATPKHNKVLLNLGIILSNYLKTHHLGDVVPETEFACGERRLRPDLAVLLGSKWNDMDRDSVPTTTMPDAVIEVVSPSETASLLLRKTQAYLQSGIAEVVLVHSDERMIFVHSDTSLRRFRGSEHLTLEILPGMSIPLDDIFESI